MNSHNLTTKNVIKKTLRNTHYVSQEEQGLLSRISTNAKVAICVGIGLIITSTGYLGFRSYSSFSSQLKRAAKSCVNLDKQIQAADEQLTAVQGENDVDQVKVTALTDKIAKLTAKKVVAEGKKKDAQTGFDQEKERALRAKEEKDAAKASD